MCVAMIDSTHHAHPKTKKAQIFLGFWASFLGRSGMPYTPAFPWKSQVGDWCRRRASTCDLHAGWEGWGKIDTRSWDSKRSAWRAPRVRNRVQESWARVRFGWIKNQDLLQGSQGSWRRYWESWFLRPSQGSKAGSEASDAGSSAGSKRKRRALATANGMDVSLPETIFFAPENRPPQ